jgi:hypothetical protein
MIDVRRTFERLCAIAVAVSLGACAGGLPPQTGPLPSETAASSSPGDSGTVSAADASRRDARAASGGPAMGDPFDDGEDDPER